MGTSLNPFFIRSMARTLTQPASSGETVLIPSSSGQWLGPPRAQARSHWQRLNPFFIRSMARTYAKEDLEDLESLNPFFIRSMARTFTQNVKLTSKRLNPFFIRSMARTSVRSTTYCLQTVLIPSSSGQWLGLLGSFFSFRDNGLQRGLSIFWATKKFSPRTLPEVAVRLPAQRRLRGSRRWVVADHTCSLSYHTQCAMERGRCARRRLQRLAYPLYLWG